MVHGERRTTLAHGTRAVLHATLHTVSGAVRSPLPRAKLLLRPYELGITFNAPTVYEGCGTTAYSDSR